MYSSIPAALITASEVDSIDVGTGGFVEAQDYEKLEGWLSERGLSVSESGADRKTTLTDYLKQHQEKVAALETSLQQAESAEAIARQDRDSLVEQLDKAKAEQQEATTLAVTTERVEKPASSSKGQPAEETGQPAGTPSPVIGSISGVTFIAIDPSNTDRIFAATFDGLYLSTDKGVNWTMVYQGTGPTKSAVISLAIDPSNPDTVYAGTLKGINKSMDGGKTWQPASGRINNEVINFIAVHPFDSQVILAATQKDGIFKSADSGDTWTQVYSIANANNVHCVAFAPSNPATIYAGTESGIYLSKDGGANWENITGLGLSSPLIHYLLVSPTDEKTAYAATLGGVYGTDDMGKHWRKLTYGTIFRTAIFLAVAAGSATNAAVNRTPTSLTPKATIIAMERR